MGEGKGVHAQWIRVMHPSSATIIDFHTHTHYIYARPHVYYEYTTYYYRVLVSVVWANLLREKTDHDGDT